MDRISLLDSYVVRHFLIDLYDEIKFGGGVIPVNDWMKYLTLKGQEVLWNKDAVNSASEEEFKELLAYVKIVRSFHDKYGKMTLAEFLNYTNE